MSNTKSQTKTDADATNDALERSFVDLIAREVGARPRQVAAASALFADGSTVPFVARYRKEATGGLDDAVLETVAKRRDYFLELQSRRDAVLEAIAEQDKLSDELEASIRAATTKQELEDLYLPYKKKRRTRAQIARERGLEPLAERLLEMAAQAGRRAEDVAAAFLDEADIDRDEVPTADDALAGARDVLAERLAENAEHRAGLRKTLETEGVLEVRVMSAKEDDADAAVYRDYFDYSEPARKMKSHRLLAVLRGEREGVLLTDLVIDDETRIHRLARSWDVRLDTPCGRQVEEATADGYRRLLRPSITNEVRSLLRERAESEAIEVFRDNLEALLMQSPLGLRPVMGLDPGLRTGCKLAVVGGTGRVVATDTIFPIASNAAKEAAAAERMVELAKTHSVHAIAVGNGTGSRETESFARRAARDAGLEVIVAIVPETGASVYSASSVAREELPDLDVSLRGAVSIARRLQDPMAELVKIEPKSLGVGQYQHDVDQRRLSDELDLAVEGVVNRVGVELNTASPSLLQKVSGLSERMARNVVKRRDEKGPYRGRQELLEVRGLGPKTFELAAGFLRIHDGDHPLDRTAVHPERYDLVAEMAGALSVDVPELVGSPQLAASLDLGRFVDEDAGVGRFTLEDIQQELEKPGRDPRPEFRAPEWREDVTTLEDLKPGMQLEGRVSNVTNFGAFVDLGVKRDGLVHVSELSDAWVEDPREVVKAGQIVKVRVLDVDRERGRISLSMKSPDGAGRPAPKKRGGGGRPASGSSKGPGKASKKPGVADLARKFNRR